MTLSDCLAFLSLTYALIYFTFGSGWSAMQKPELLEDPSKLRNEAFNVEYLTPPPKMITKIITKKRRSLSHTFICNEETESLIPKDGFYSEDGSATAQSFRNNDQLLVLNKKQDSQPIEIIYQEPQLKSIMEQTNFKTEVLPVLGK